MGAGVFFTLLRILFCTVPSCCRACFSCCCCRDGRQDEKKLLENGTARVRFFFCGAKKCSCFDFGPIVHPRQYANRRAAKMSPLVVAQ